MATVTAKSGATAGRPAVNANSGASYKLAEYLRSQWFKVGQTNKVLADQWGYRSPGIISMWQMGTTRVPIEMIPNLARLLNVDIATLMPLWLEQYTGEHGGGVTSEIMRVFDRMATTNEFAVLGHMRKGAGRAGKTDPVYTARQLQAIEAITADDKFTNLVLEEALKAGAIKELEDED